MTAEDFADRLEARRSGNGWMAHCPAHEDRNSSLSINESSDGNVLVHCHAGCSTEVILAKLGLKPKDLFAKAKPIGQVTGTSRNVVAEYVYRDADGKPVYRKLRTEPKGFFIESLDGRGVWRPGANGAEPILYRLPEVLKAVAVGQTIYVVEGEKDVDSLVDRGLIATCNRGGASEWRKTDAEPLFDAAKVVVVVDKDAAGRAHALAVARSLAGKVGSLRVIECPDFNGHPVKDVSDFFEAGAPRESFTLLADHYPEWTEPSESGGEVDLKPEGEEHSESLDDDPRPAIQLPGNDRLISDFARKLAYELSNANVFTNAGSVVVVNQRGDGLRSIGAVELRTLIEKYVVCFESSYASKGKPQRIKRTMSKDHASAVIASPQFYEGLRPIERFAPVPMPVIRADETLELLPRGYDAATRTFTAEEGVEPDLIEPAQAQVILRELLSEFVFTDSGRSLAVTVAGILTVFGYGLLPPSSLRPCFAFMANAEGAGKSLLVQICTVPMLGDAPVGSRPHDEDEMRKTLVATTIEAKPVLLFDNLKGHLSSESLEAFLSSTTFGGRILGESRNVSGPNCATVFLTGNGCTFSPDMRRRSLFCELFLEVDRSEDRVFRQELGVALLLERRAEILGALWALIQSWDCAGRPVPGRSHASFPQWARIIGGIVEHAGFGCPLETAHIKAAADTEADDMRELVAAALGEDTRRTLLFEQLVGIAHKHGLFPHIVTDKIGLLDKTAKSRLGKLFQRFDDRLVGGSRFSLEGKGHSRRFRIERAGPALTGENQSLPVKE